MRRLIAAAALCVTALFASAAGAQAAAPAWSIVAIPFPSAFKAGTSAGSAHAGPGYQVQVFNVGGAPTVGGFKITDTLPKGMLPSPDFSPSGVYGPPMTNELKLRLSCSALGRTVTCTTSGALLPGESASATVPVEVQANAAGTPVNSAKVEGGGAAAVNTTTPTPISSSPSPFGFIEGPAGLYGFATTADGQPATQAGSHPYEEVVAGMAITTNPDSPGNPDVLPAGGGLHELVAELPPGTVVNPEATQQCTEAQLHTKAPGCPAETQVGTVALTLSIAEGLGEEPKPQPLFNMVPPPGYPAELGFEIFEGTYVHLLGSVRSDGSFILAAASRDTLAKAAIGGVRTVLWGDPTDASHDAQRGACILVSRLEPECPTARTHRAFLTLPSACSGPLPTAVRMDSWLEQGTFVERSYPSSGPDGSPVGIAGCSSLDFEPSIEVKPTTHQADSPSGLEFDLRQAQREGTEELGNAPLDDTTVALPEGMTLNPAAGDGLEACTTAQIGYHPEAGKVRYLEDPARCPNAAKLGTVTVTTPLLKEGPQGGRIPHALPGAIYLAKPFDNPFGSLMAIYLVIEDESTGLLAKLAGKVVPDPTTGQLRTTFEESPQLPLEDVHLHFFDGARAALTTPLTCGTKTTTGALTPWSTTIPTAVSDSFQISDACSASEAVAPRNLSFSAGTTSPLAGSYSPFVLKLSRPDGTQRISLIDTTLPEGLTGRLAGIPYCSDAQIAQAAARSHPEEGELERQHPSCPSASEVGTVTVGAGSGPNPLYVTGRAYLAGPYKGAPLSMVIITPAVAGPFDLGVVTVRVALEVDPETARITAKSDPLPTILDGIPLDVRSIALSVDRSGFILNPTDCDASQITAAVSSPAGSSAMLSERFGVEGCNRLAFKPKLKISLKGATKRTGHPALKAVVTYPKKGAYANIARAQVGLPHALFLDQGNLNKTCTRPVLLAGHCPPSTVYGHAKAWTPLLEKPLEGPVYLVGGYGYKLPALVGELNGQIRILLKGRVDTTKRHGIRNTFEVVPDAPVSRFVLQMKGGKKYSLLENSENLCATAQKANARFVAQNGRVTQLRPRIGVRCGGKKAKGHRGHHRKPGAGKSKR